MQFSLGKEARKPIHKKGKCPRLHLATLYRRSLAFHWPTHLATMLGVAVAAAVLTGALVVGDSIRGSLRARALGRLGRVDHALIARSYFRESLAADVADVAQRAGRHIQACPVILLRGGVHHAVSRTRVNRMNVLGVDERFWSLSGSDNADGSPTDTGRSVILNEPLARELGAEIGDDVLVRLEYRQWVSAETLLGRRDGMSISLRLTVRRILPADGPGGFSVKPTQDYPYNAFVPLSTLQRALQQRGQVNAVLIASEPGRPTPGQDEADLLQRVLDEQVQLSDFGLRLRRDAARGYVALESERLLLEPAVETAAIEAAGEMGTGHVPVLTYLANTIAHGQREIPYSVVAAIDTDVGAAVASMTLVDGEPVSTIGDDEILLNEWAANDLDANPGDEIRLAYYMPDRFGQLRTEQARFTLRGVVRIQGFAGDRSLTPEYEGITDATDLTDWDPPFPIDLTRIREKDEQYWDDYGATPKAFVALATGQELWTRTQSRFGKLTSIRVGIPEGGDAETIATRFKRRLLDRLPAAKMGLTVEPIRSQALTAARGSTDFGMLFIGFSMFLIASAAMLVALMFRLGVERRSSEVGILLATGFRPRTVTGLLLLEGALPAGIGSALGLLGAAGYAWVKLAGLRSWWSTANNAPFLQLHIYPSSLMIGYGASVVMGLLSVAWAVRGLGRMSPRSLLAGGTLTGVGASRARRVRSLVALAAGALIVALALIVLSAGTGVLPQAPAFFGSGAVTLVACLAGLAAWAARTRCATIHGSGPAAIARLGVRNAGRHPRRSLLTAGLIASATFITVAVGVNRHPELIAINRVTRHTTDIPEPVALRCWPNRRSPCFMTSIQPKGAKP